MAFKPKGKFRKRKLSDGQEDLERFCGKGDVMNLSENARRENKVFSSLCSSPNSTIRTRTKSYGSVETLKRSLADLMASCDEQMRFTAYDLKTVQQYAVDVILDPDTANSKLILSDDGKQVRHGNKRLNLPDNPERFTRCPCVLGNQGFSSGRFYYEVQVCGKTDWVLGIAGGSISRKEKVIFSPKFDYWTVWLRNNTEYEACDSPPVLLTLNQVLQKVGVFVDYEEGLISFYDVDTGSHIYSFTDQLFMGGLYPYLCPSVNYRGLNSAPLIITHVNHEDAFLTQTVISR